MGGDYEVVDFIIGLPELLFTFPGETNGSLISVTLPVESVHGHQSSQISGFSHWGLSSAKFVFPTLFPSVIYPLISTWRITVLEPGIKTVSFLLPGATCGHILVFPHLFLAPLWIFLWLIPFIVEGGSEP